MNDIKTQPDKTPHKGRRMMNASSPISFFLLATDGMLKPVAIQVNSKKGKH